MPQPRPSDLVTPPGTPRKVVRVSLDGPSLPLDTFPATILEETEDTALAPLVAPLMVGATHGPPAEASAGASTGLATPVAAAPPMSPDRDPTVSSLGSEDDVPVSSPVRPVPKVKPSPPLKLSKSQQKKLRGKTKGLQQKKQQGS